MKLLKIEKQKDLHQEDLFPISVQARNHMVLVWLRAAMIICGCKFIEARSLFAKKVMKLPLAHL